MRRAKKPGPGIPEPTMEEIVAAIRQIIAEDTGLEPAAFKSSMPGESTGEEHLDSAQQLLCEGEAIYASLAFDAEPVINPPSGAAGIAFKNARIFRSERRSQGRLPS